jgi:general secretion pathway protein K
MALVLVLVFVLLLVGSIATFLHRAVLDATIVANRDATSRAEALARGGVRLATALLLEDRLEEQASGLRAETRRDPWARARRLALPLADDATLSLRVEDAGARLDLNALFEDGQAKDAATESYLLALMQKAIDELPRSADAHGYDPEVLAHNLMDYVDADSERVKGGAEDEEYLARRPPSRAANRALLSVDELRAVEGFTPELVEALRPYVTVYPYTGSNIGINPNTAPPWVLALLYTGVSGDKRLVEEEDVRRILETREAGALLCADEASHPSCTPLRSILPDGVFPEASFEADVFVVTAEARAGDAVRTVTAVVDRSELAKPKLLAIHSR